MLLPPSGVDESVTVSLGCCRPLDRSEPVIGRLFAGKVLKSCSDDGCWLALSICL